MSDDQLLIDYELDDVVDAGTPEQLRALGDPVRQLILDLVLERGMSVTDLAAQVERSKGTVAHHVDVLLATGLLKVVRTRKVRALEERFYGRTARTIQFPGPAHGGPSFIGDALREYEPGADGEVRVEETTLRHARIPAERAAEFGARLMDLAVEFSVEPRGGDVEYALLIALFPSNRRRTLAS